MSAYHGKLSLSLSHGQDLPVIGQLSLSSNDPRLD
jgi:hypothetical protein